MELIKNKITKEPENVIRVNFLELAKKDAKGIPQPYPVENPVHHVKLLRGEEGTNKDFHGKEVEGVWLHFEEEGMEKKYFVPTYYNDKNSDKYGKFYYLFEKFAEVPEGSLLEIEYIRKGASGYIDVRTESVNIPQVNSDDIPIVEDDIKAEDIPF